jgi:hypothetical protein
LTPESGIRDCGWVENRIRIRDEQPGPYFIELRNHFFWVKIPYLLKFFDADPGWKKFGSGMKKRRIRDGKNLDPGWKKVGSGSATQSGTLTSARSQCSALASCSLSSWRFLQGTPAPQSLQWVVVDRSPPTPNQGNRARRWFSFSTAWTVHGVTKSNIRLGKKYTIFDAEYYSIILV